MVLSTVTIGANGGIGGFHQPQRGGAGGGLIPGMMAQATIHAVDNLVVVVVVGSAGNCCRIWSTMGMEMVVVRWWSLYDTSQIRSHLNPPKSVYPQASQSITYIDPKFIQLRIYYKCESEFFSKKTTSQ